MPAHRAGQRLAQAFQQATTGRPGLHEDELLAELTDALAAMGELDGLAAEAHPGRRFFVAFDPREGLGGQRRRTQLADLLLVTYAPRRPPAVCFTLVQARRRSGPLASMEGDVPLARGRVNVFHWDLLHRRPRIEAIGHVRPPATLLQEARSPAAASFAFFHRPDRDRWDLSMVSAGALRPWGEWPPADRPRRTARFPAVTAWQRREGRRETISAAGLADLGELLARQAVGAPLAVPPETEHDRLTASWLIAALATTVRRRDPGEAELAADLHDRLTDALEGAGLVDLDSSAGAPPLAIVRTEA